MVDCLADLRKDTTIPKIKTTGDANNMGCSNPKDANSVIKNHLPIPRTPFRLVEKLPAGEFLAEFNVLLNESNSTFPTKRM